MTLPERVDLSPFINGDSATLIIDLTNSATGEPLPLTGWVFILTAKYSKYQEDHESVIQKTIVTDNDSQVIFTFNPEDTRLLVTTTYEYDIQVSDATAAAVSTPFMGRLKIERGVTQEAP